MESNRYKQIRCISLWGGLKNIFLAAFKIIFGVTGHSHALIADGVHSFSDLLVDTIVIIASKFGSKAADEDHPYGHGRIETAATVFLALILVLAGFSIIISAGFELTKKHINTVPSHWVLWIATISIILNEALYFLAKRIAKQVKSLLLMTNAWHHRSDSTSSLAVIFGVIGSWSGFPKFDAIAASIVGAMIFKVAWNFGWQSIQELVDTVPSLDETKKIKQIIKKVPGVITLHQLRTRSIGGSIFCDVHVLVNPKISVSEGHHIGQEVESQLISSLSKVADVTVHVDTEDDELTNPSRNLPDRSTLEPILLKEWKYFISEKFIKKATLHYQNGKILVELKLPLSFLDRSTLLEDLKKIMVSKKIITDIKLYYYKTRD